MITCGHSAHPHLSASCYAEASHRHSSRARLSPLLPGPWQPLFCICFAVFRFREYTDLCSIGPSVVARMIKTQRETLGLKQKIRKAKQRSHLRVLTSLKAQVNKRVILSSRRLQTAMLSTILGSRIFEGLSRLVLARFDSHSFFVSCLSNLASMLLRQEHLLAQCLNFATKSQLHVEFH